MELFVRIYQSPERKRGGFFRTLNTYQTLVCGAIMRSDNDSLPFTRRAS